ncbi:alpha/beta hydrolase [Actinomycetes bacterium M1A6_2h]
MDRRTVLRLGALATLLTACGKDQPVRTPDRPGEGRRTYGSDPSQFGELYLPSGTPRGVVVVIHGGFWRSRYDYTLGSPLATDLSDKGWAALNLEYRRVGNGGGNPATFDDVAAGIDMLAETDLNLSTVVTLGHSAGGHLAAWAASRGRDARWSGGVAVSHVLSQAGVLDLVTAAKDDLGDGAVQALLGHSPGPMDSIFDPQQQIPLDVPVWCVHGDRDSNVPIDQSTSYVEAATTAGARAEMVRVSGDHMVLIDPTSQPWARTLQILDTIG